MVKFAVKFYGLNQNLIITRREDESKITSNLTRQEPNLTAQIAVKFGQILRQAKFTIRFVKFKAY